MNKYRCYYSMWQISAPLKGDVDVVAENETQAKKAAKTYLWKHHPAVEFSSSTITIEDVVLLETDVEE